MYYVWRIEVGESYSERKYAKFVFMAKETKKNRRKMTLPERMAVELKKSMKDGDLSNDVYLPSSRELASRYGTSLITMQKALHRLRDEKIIRLHSSRKGFTRVGEVSKNNKRTAIKQVAMLWPKRPESEKNSVSRCHNGTWDGHIIESLTRNLSVNDYHCIPIFYDKYKGEPPHPNISVETAMERIAKNDGFDGVFFFPDQSLAGIDDELERQNIPWVSINPIRDFIGNFVIADNVQGGRIVGKYFARMGFKRILYVSTSIETMSSSAMGRLTGLFQSLVQERVSIEGFSNVIVTDEPRPQVCQAITEYLDKNGPPDLIFCSGDFLAIEAIRACQNKGYSIPEQVGIIGGTGLEITAEYNPCVSVLAQPMEEMGREVADMLRKMVENRTMHLPGRYVPSKFIIRQSLKVDNAVIESLQKEFGDQVVVDI